MKTLSLKIQVEERKEQRSFTYYDRELTPKKALEIYIHGRSTERYVVESDDEKKRWKVCRLRDGEWHIISPYRSEGAAIMSLVDSSDLKEEPF